MIVEEDFMTRIKYRLGLDLGATSIGWALYDIENEKIIDLGVRIFDDGRDAKSKASLCVKRREARGVRRLNNRLHMKKESLINELVRIGLLPEDEQARKSLKTLNPYRDIKSDDVDEMEKIKKERRMPIYALRAKALDNKLELYEIGRVLLLLAQRKGFKSSRKDNKESANYKKGNDLLKKEMDKYKARTYGEYLYKHHLEYPDKPIRLKNALNKENKLEEGIAFPYREDYEHEFNMIWEKQKKYYPDTLNDNNKERVKDILFLQRPLKEQEVGMCSLEPNEERIPKAHPLFQEFRILQYINNLKLMRENTDKFESLDENQREILIDKALNPDSVSKKILDFKEIRKLLKLNSKDKFNYEVSTNQDIPPFNTTERAIKEILNERQKTGKNETISDIDTLEKQKLIQQDAEELKNFWEQLDSEIKGKIIYILDRPSKYIGRQRTAELEEQKTAKYLQDTYSLSPGASELLLRVKFKDSFEAGYGNLSEKAIRKILPYLRKGCKYDEACKEAGYNHSSNKVEPEEFLPYYGKILQESCLGKKDNPKTDEERFGKISNATVHVALNQVRPLVNEIIKIYGKPYDISIEYSRELPASAKERNKIIKNQEKNSAYKEKVREIIREKCNGAEASEQDIIKYKIWESMNADPCKRVCPYSGKQICICELLGAEMEIDHILPFSRTFDDSINNKIICFREANRIKSGRTPYEAFGHNNSPYDWDKILQNIANLNEERKWKFMPDAMEKFEKNGGPIARLLNDTRYISRIMQKYLLPIVDEDGYRNIQAITGQLTSMIRKAWGLNEYKDRENPLIYRTEHYHHAIDAVVIATVDREQIKEFSRRYHLEVKDRITIEFKNDIKKLNDKNISKDEKADIRKKIKNREDELTLNLIKIPKSLNVQEIKEKVSNINISHKPNLKNIHNLNSTVGQLHEDTAYGLNRTNKNEKPDIKSIFYTTDSDTKELKQKKGKITDLIPIFYKKEDRDAYFDAYKEWFIIQGKKECVKDKHLKKELENEENLAVSKLINVAYKAFKWFVGGNNFCIVIYEIPQKNKINGVPTNNQGEWEAEVVSNYNATMRARRKECISYLPYRWPTAKKVMELRQNDMVMITFTREEIEKEVNKGDKLFIHINKKAVESDEEAVNFLFRVKKFVNSTNGVYFTPHDLAREEGDSMSWNMSAKVMQKHKVRKVLVSFTGKIKYV